MIGLFKKPVVIKHTDGFGNVYESDEYIKMRESYMNEYMTRHGETTLHNARIAFGITMQPAMYTKREALEFLPLADEFNALEEKMKAAGISFKVEDDEEVCTENTEYVDSSSENEVAEKVDQEPAASVYHAVVMEKVAEMDLKTLILNPNAAMPQYIMDKHYNRKHGKNAYYGQAK